MGHANLQNLSEFFIRRLYARGELSIHDCVAAMQVKGEELHASEGGYDDVVMLSYGVGQIVHYLSLENPSQHHYSGPAGGGPWIVPVLTAWRGRRKQVNRVTALMLDGLDVWSEQDHGMDQATVGVLADRLIDEDLSWWADWIRQLTRRRQVWAQWVLGTDDDWDWGSPGTDGEIFDSIPWRFAPGKRKTYPDGIPVLSNVSN